MRPMKTDIQVPCNSDVIWSMSKIAEFGYLNSTNILAASSYACEATSKERMSLTIGPFFPMCVPSMCLAAQPCPTLCDPLDCRPPGYSVHGIFQARILKWIVISFSRGSSQLKDRTCVSYVPCIAGVIRAKLFLFICFYKVSVGCYHQGFLCYWLKFGTQKSSLPLSFLFP